MPELHVKDDEQDKEEEYEDELTAALDKTQAGTQDSKEETKEDDSKEEEGTKEDEKGTEPDEEVTLKKSEYEALQNQLQSSRSLALSQKRQLASLETTVKRLERNQTKLVTPPASSEEDDDLDDEGSGKKPAEVKLEGPGEEEQIQANLKKIADERGGMFELMLEQMAGMDAYKDVGEVCSDTHTQDIIHAVADQMAQEGETDFALAALKVEEHIWSQSNPYKYLYNLIKEYHPNYASAKKGEESKGGKKEESKEKASAKEAVKAPGSIAGFTGSHKGEEVGWTAKRIDELPEDELHTVPDDVYEKYMAGHLD